MCAQKLSFDYAQTLHTVRIVHNAHSVHRSRVQKGKSCDCINFVRAIDPPYNTGNDFIYADNFMHSQEEENQQMGMYDEETGDRLFKNTDTNGRFHSDWCSMIYSRLMLARNLLTDEGGIFISIDDNEQENLKKCCDEVFETRCFLATFVWKRRASSQLDKSKCYTDHEYVLAYTGKTFQAFRGIDKDYKGYSNPDNDPRGPWTTNRKGL